MAKLSAHKTTGYASDGAKRARKVYTCECCGGLIEKGDYYERYMGFPTHYHAMGTMPGPNCKRLYKVVGVVVEADRQHVGKTGELLDVAPGFEPQFDGLRLRLYDEPRTVISASRYALEAVNADQWQEAEEFLSAGRETGGWDSLPARD